jgi:ATP-dependent exoDNAse (exonuclease V) beta subunit
MRRAARVDATSTALVKRARKLGAEYVPLNSIIDGLLFHRGRVYLVDWKSPGGSLTPDQAKLTARGWPIFYISTVEQLEGLLR